MTNNYSGNDCLKIGSLWWERSVNPSISTSFLNVFGSGGPSNGNGATTSRCVCPAFSF